MSYSFRDTLDENMEENPPKEQGHAEVRCWTEGLGSELDPYSPNRRHS